MGLVLIVGIWLTYALGFATGQVATIVLAIGLTCVPVVVNFLLNTKGAKARFGEKNP
jgi:hypothetical protein